MMNMLVFFVNKPIFQMQLDNLFEAKDLTIILKKKIKEAAFPKCGVGNNRMTEASKD